MKIPYTSKLYRFKNIKNRNKAFNSLDKITQRKEIALDALKLVINKKIDASWGHYWNWSSKTIKKVYKTETSEELQNVFLNDLDKSCTVCQRGLMMISTIRLGNEISSNIHSIEKGSEDIIKGFCIDNFYDMEKEYEDSVFDHPYKNNTKYKLANICCNIIANGNFNVRDKSDYLKLWKIKLN